MTRGTAWFAIGNPKDIGLLAELPDASTPASTVTPTSNSDPHEDLNTCIRFGTGAIALQATDPTEYQEQIVSLDQLYPGLQSVVESATTSEERRKISALDQGDPYRYDAYLAQFVQGVKKFCRNNS